MTAGADADSVAALSAFAKNLGLAFQIIDDLLDVEGDPAQTGKAIRKDARKTTFVSFSGVAGAHALAAELCQTADRALAPFGRRADRLRELSAFVGGAQDLTRMTSAPERRPARRRAASAASLARLPRRRRGSFRSRTGALDTTPDGHRAPRQPPRGGPCRAPAGPCRGPRPQRTRAGPRHRPAGRPRRGDLSRRVLRRRHDRSGARRESPRVVGLATIPVADSRGAGRGSPRAAGGLVTLLCLIYLTLWWQTVIAGLGWSAPLWTLSALALAAAMSLLLGHAVAVASSAVTLAAAGDKAAAPNGAGSSRRPWPTTIAAGALAFAGAALLLTWSADSTREAPARRRADGGSRWPAPPRHCDRRLRRAHLRGALLERPAPGPDGDAAQHARAARAARR